MKVQLEMTDTFGGEANYSWVRRETLLVPDDITNRSLVRQAKKHLGIENTKHLTTDFGDDIRLDIKGQNIVVFITPVT